jgi:hypothetical protein
MPHGLSRRAPRNSPPLCRIFVPWQRYTYKDSSWVFSIHFWFRWIDRPGQVYFPFNDVFILISSKIRLRGWRSFHIYPMK